MYLKCNKFFVNQIFAFAKQLTLKLSHNHFKVGPAVSLPFVA